MAVVEQARKDGYTSTVSLGAGVTLPELDSSNRQVREAAERAALNAPIQGSAADIIKVAMIGASMPRCDEAGLSSRLLLQVHDELLLEVAPGERDAVEALVRAIGWAAPTLDVPLEVSVGYGLQLATRPHTNFWHINAPGERDGIVFRCRSAPRLISKSAVVARGPSVRLINV